MATSSAACGSEYESTPVRSQQLLPQHSSSFPMPLSSSPVIARTYHEPLRVPAEIELSGDRNFAIWQSGYESAWNNWWPSTPRGIDITINNKGSSPNWNSTNRHRAYWKSFKQVAKISTGEPHILCKFCSTILKHPSVVGNTNMRRHVGSSACISKGSGVGSDQSTLPDAFYGVSLNFNYHNA
jgi:hypothetical protein